MKLLNYTLRYLSLSLLVVLSLWAMIFYFFMLGEVKESIDEGLTNYKMLIVFRAQADSSMLTTTDFGDRNYSAVQIPAAKAIQVLDTYKDTLMYIERVEAYEPVRLLTTAFAVGEKYYELKIISAAINKAELIRKVLVSFIVLYGFLMVSIILVNNFVLKKVWKPFHYLLGQLRSFKLGNTPIFPSADTKVSEFRELNDALLSLLQRNLSSFLSQKQFIENASHELQTPLAISINKLELLAESTRLSDREAETIGNVMHTLERLTRLNKSLLLLSRIENQQFGADHEISFNELFKKQVPEFSDIARFRQVTIQLIEEQVFRVNMHKDLAEILVVNLLKNAIVHNIPGGSVMIRIWEKGFSVENTGADGVLDAHRMYDRFYKKSAESGSTGLGLAIVKGIVGLYGLTIVYSFEGLHRFTISGEEDNAPEHPEERS